MITFKTYIQEGKAGKATASSSRAKEISMAQAVKLAKERCKIALSFDEPVILRGSMSNAKYAFSTPGLNSRVSENTSNETTLLVDNSKAWSKYPKRSESLICTTIGNASYAGDYGSIKIVLPVDSGTNNIGVCVTHDFWFSFPRIETEFKSFKMDGVDDFNNTLRNAIRQVVEIDPPASNNSNFNHLEGALNALGRKLIANPEYANGYYKRLFKSFFNKSGEFKNFTDYCQWILDPSANNFLNISYQQLYKHRDEEREVWTDRDSILIEVPNIGKRFDAEAIDAFLEFKDRVYDHDV